MILIPLSKEKYAGCPRRNVPDFGRVIGILYHKEHPPEVWHIPPGTPCIFFCGKGNENHEV
jgi:hypothetical protein